MEKYIDLQKRMLELRLEKRDLILAGKNTNTIDKQIKILENQLKK